MTLPKARHRRKVGRTVDDVAARRIGAERTIGLATRGQYEAPSRGGLLMIADMEYDGQRLDWKGMGKFKATSGLESSQIPAQQCTRDAGPVPEGLYKVYLVERGGAC